MGWIHTVRDNMGLEMISIDCLSCRPGSERTVNAEYDWLGWDAWVGTDIPQVLTVCCV